MGLRPDKAKDLHQSSKFILGTLADLLHAWRQVDFSRNLQCAGLDANWNCDSYDTGTKQNKTNVNQKELCTEAAEAWKQPLTSLTVGAARKEMRGKRSTPCHFSSVLIKKR